MSEVKELWLEIVSDFSNQEKETVHLFASSYSDAIIEGNKVTFLAKKETIILIAPPYENISEQIDADKRILRICISDKRDEGPSC